MKIDFKTKSLKSAEELSQEAVSFEVEKAKLQLNSDILATEQSLVNKKAELEDAKCTVPLNSMNIVNLQIEVESLEDGLKRLKALAKEFGFTK